MVLLSKFVKNEGTSKIILELGAARKRISELDYLHDEYAKPQDL